MGGHAFAFIMESVLQQLRDYLDGPFKDVQGWCIPQLWQSIQPIHEVQQKNGIAGAIAEIGVFHGKFFLGLVKTKNVPGNYAIDVFSMQRFNLDGAGAGNLEKVKANMVLTGTPDGDVEFLERDSMAIDRCEIEDIRGRTDGGFSMFSVDGCHMVEHTINDTRIAMKLTRPGGIIFVDDYYNANWPGVQEGICKLFLTDCPRFVPLVFSCNKLILCHISYHAEYLKYVAEFIKARFPTTRMKRVDRFGYPSLTVQPNFQEGPCLADEAEAPASAAA